jgi:hypothetical protein
MYVEYGKFMADDLNDFTYVVRDKLYLHLSVSPCDGLLSAFLLYLHF